MANVSNFSLEHYTEHISKYYLKRGLNLNLITSSEKFPTKLQSRIQVSSEYC